MVREGKAEKDPLLDRIEQIVTRFARYGYRRVTAQLKREGYVVNHKRVARLLRQNHWQCRSRKDWIVTTEVDPANPVFPNRIKEVKIVRINQVWVADITAIRIQGELAYLAVVLDAYSRKIIGWALSWQKTEDLTLTALKIALRRRRPPPGWIHHSDRGAQYTCGYYVNLVKSNGGVMSMSAPGNPYENAIMERCMGTIKREEVKLTEYESLAEAYERLEYFIETVYNRKWLHSSLGYKSPVEFEAALAS